MRPKKLIPVLDNQMDSGIPLYLWGAPGIGKSDIIRQIAQRREMDLIDVRAVLLDPVDLRGLPHVNGDSRAHWCPPAFLPYDPASKGILFLDELAQAPPLVQSACLQLTLDRRLGEYKLPDGWIIVAASNRQEDRAGVHKLITPLLNRFMHFEIEVSNEDWHEWAVANKIDSRVRSFLQYRANLLHQFDPKTNAKAFPTPRSWSFASRAISVMTDADGMFEVVKGCVGEGAATEFVAYVQVYSQLPDPAKILADPMNHDTPPDGEPAVLYALGGALVEHVRQKPNLGAALVQFAGRIAPEFGVLYVRDAMNVCPNILNTPEGTAWCKKNRDVLLQT